MPLATSLTQPLDSRGFPFHAIRPAKSWVTSLSGAGTYVAGPFLATTRVVRVVAGINDIVRVVFNQIDPDPIILARGVYQDFMVQAGDTITLSLDPLSASGNASVIELGGAAPTLLLDIAAGASAAAYSLRRMAMAYSGPAVRIRRASDNAQQDIGFLATGDFDVASFNSFIGASQGFVATWYDQSGLGNNNVQVAAANQPSLVASVAALGGKPAILFGDNSAAYLTISGNSSLAGMFAAGGTASAVATIASTPSTNNDRLWQRGSVMQFKVATPNNLGFTQTASTTNAFWNYPTVPVGAHVIDLTYSSASLANVPVVSVDGAAQTLGTSQQPVGTINSDAATPLTLGGSGGSLGWNGHIAEAIFWKFVATLPPIRANQKSYWGTP